jgi:branched-chain amino acid transport system substrate-binding protein
MNGPKKHRRAFVGAALVLTLALAGVGCGDEDTDREGPRLEIVIGSSVPTTGPLEEFGPAGKKAANLAREVIGDAVREIGRRHAVDVVHVDNGGGEDPDVAVRGARELAEEDDASCIVGAWASTDTLAIARQIAIPERVPLISPASPSDEITELDDDGFVYRTTPSDSVQGPTLTQAISDDLGAADKTVNVAARDDRYGRGIANRFIESWKDLGGTIGAHVFYDPLSLSLDGPARKLTKGEPDATLIVDFPQSFERLSQPLLEGDDFDPATAWSADGLAAAPLPKDLDRAAVQGLRGTVPGIPAADEATEAFRERFESSEPTGVEPQTFDAQAFDATILCYLAAVAAGSGAPGKIARELEAVSAPPGDPYGWQELSDAVEALEAGEEIDYQGASGAINFNGDGDTTAGTYDIYRYRDGELEIIDEVPLNVG